ncbi:MAG: hypothetical protein V4662_25115 [Verrucomicrobiota bacterium]
MDRDDSLMISGTALATPADAPSAFDVAFNRFPPAVRTEVLRLDSIMRQIHAARFTQRACRDHASEDLSAETLKRMYYGKGATKGFGWKDIGMAALVDHRRCGGCGLAGCQHQQELTIPEAILKHWKREAISNDKAGLAESWKKIIRALCDGGRVEDMGWRDLYAKAAPYAPMPDRCPWSLMRTPPGWSLPSFMRHKMDKMLLDLGRKGSFVAWDELPEVRIDLTGLRPFEWLVVDDHRLDFKVFVTMPDGKVQLVELWGLFVMDVATRMIVSFALKPRVEREDGTFQAFEHRDMQHLICHVLTTYGVPQGYNQRWIVENAAAAVSTEAENLITFITQGQVTIKRSGIQVGDFHCTGFPERWGNYRGKRWIESYFGGLDIILGGVKGQMGSDYWSKPGSFDARQAFGNRLLKLLDACTPEVRAKLELPFEWAGEAHWLVSEAVALLNHRMDHQLEGFEEIRFFAYDQASQPVPMHPRLAALHGVETQLETFSKVPPQLQEMWLNLGGRPRRLTPAEKMEILRPKMARMSAEAVLDLLFDEVTSYQRKPLIWRGGDALDIEVRRGRTKVKMRFYGAIRGVEQGQRVIARLDSDRVSCGLWLLDEQRRFLGHMRYSTDPTHADVDGLHRMMGAQIKALGQAKDRLTRLTLPAGLADRRMAGMEQITDTIHTLAADAQEEAEIPALAESSGLVEAIRTGAKAPAHAMSDAEFYRAMKATV